MTHGRSDGGVGSFEGGAFEQPDRDRLLALARRAMEARVLRTPLPAGERGGVLEVVRAAFVTIHVRRELRGCLGRLRADMPLWRTVTELASAVVDSDPRFDPVSPGELGHLEIEISLLTVARSIQTPEEIEVGRHGLIVEEGRRRGLLLPQVAVEHRWDRVTFLNHVCLKAGLKADAWRHGALLSTFEAEVFGDQRPYDRT